MDEQFPLALQPGSVLAGQYVIQKVLGQGGFGITYMAEDHKTGEKVAVKEFFPDTLATRTQNTVSSYPGERTDSFQYGKACFLQEAETLAAFIGSENIVKIHSYFEENGTAYFVMDFVEGISFDEYIRQKGGKISYDDAERVLIHIIDALALVHSKGIVHRDVTPDNIYITSDGTVKLLDFGAARYSLGDKSRSLDVVLKHGFAPKEQYTRHGRQGPFTDVYTVGASFYYAITGKRPPDSIDRLEEDDLVPPSSLGVAIPRKKEDAILKAMSVQPQDRFQSMGAFKNALLADGAVQAAPQPADVTNQRVFTAPSQPVQTPQQPMSPQPAPVQTQPVPPQQGPVVQPTAGQPAAAPKRNNKFTWVAVIAIVAAVLFVIIVGFGIVGAMSNSKQDRTPSYADASDEGEETQQPTVRPTSEPTAEPTPKPTVEPTPEPTQAPTEESLPADTDTVEILGNTVADIKNNNLICADPETWDLYYFDGTGLVGSSGNYLFTGVMPCSLSVVGDYIYYVASSDGKTYRVNKNGGTPEGVFYFTDAEIGALYVSQSYYFLNALNEDGNNLMLRWDIQNEEITGRIVLTAEDPATAQETTTLTAFSDGYLYYVDKTGEQDTVYRVPAGGDWTSPQKLCVYKAYVEVEEICVEDDRVYMLYSYPYQDSSDDGDVDANGTVHAIDIINAVSGDDINGWRWYGNADIAAYYSNMRAEDGMLYYIKEQVDVATGAYTCSFIQFRPDDLSGQTLYTDTDLDGRQGLCVLYHTILAAYGKTGDTLRLYWIPLDGSEPEVNDYQWNIN